MVFMKKSIATAVSISLITAGLAGCAPGQSTPGATVIGAAAGGFLGGAIGRGNVAGIIAGTLIGGSVGYLIGRHMDRQDRINMSNAIVNTPIGQEAVWTNSDTHITYHVRPVRQYHRNGRYCREYRTRVKIGDRWRNAYGTACHTPGVGWRIVN